MAATSHALPPESPEPDELEPQHATGLLLGHPLKPRSEHSRESRVTAPFHPDQLPPAGALDGSGATYVERARAPWQRGPGAKSR
jgi:hypothetical protein